MFLFKNELVNSKYSGGSLEIGLTMVLKDSCSLNKMKNIKMLAKVNLYTFLIVP